VVLCALSISSIHFEAWLPFASKVCKFFDADMELPKSLTVWCLYWNFDLQALQRALAIKQLLDPMFWQSHRNNLMPSSRIEQQSHLTEDIEFKGISWKVVWVLL
jgi:hypothetical protein